MTVEHYLALINNAVRFYPHNTIRCLQPQTYAHLDSDYNLNDPNLGKYICDKDKPYFFSRVWESLKYNPSQLRLEPPIVATFEQAGDLKYVGQVKQETTYTFQLSVLDVYNEDAKKVQCHGCAGRVVNELYRDTETIMYNILAYIDDVVVVFEDGENKLYNRQHWEYLEGEGATGVLDEALTSTFKNDQKQNNVQRAFHRIEPYTGSKFHGTSTTIRMTIKNCQNVEFDFTSSSGGEIPDKGCC